MKPKVILLFLLPITFLIYFDVLDVGKEVRKHHQHGIGCIKH